MGRTLGTCRSSICLDAHLSRDHEWWAVCANQDIRHPGRTVQDPLVALCLGENATPYSATDLTGLSLAAIQCLHQFGQEPSPLVTPREEIEALRPQPAELAVHLAVLQGHAE